MVFHGRGNQNIHRKFQQGLVRDRLGTGESRKLISVRGTVGQGLFDIDSIGIVIAPGDVRNGQDFETLLFHQFGRNRSHIAEALHGTSGFERIQSHLEHGRAGCHHHATTCGFDTALGAPHDQGFTGDHRWGRIADQPGILVHNPGHFAWSCTHVRSRDILFRTKNIDHSPGIGSREALQFTGGHGTRVAFNAPFAAAKRNIRNRTFPSHPSRKGLDLIQIDIQGITYPTFGRAEVDVMNHPNSLKNLNAAVVHRNGEIHNDLLGRGFEHVIEALVQIENFCRHIKAGHHGLEWILVGRDEGGFGVHKRI